MAGRKKAVSAKAKATAKRTATKTAKKHAKKHAKKTAKRKPAATLKPKPRATARGAKANAKATPKPKAKPKPKARAKKPAAASAGAFAERFERGSYELPVMDLAEAIDLAAALLAKKPARATAAIDEDVARVRAALARARKVAPSDGAALSVDARAHDVAMDRAWGTFVRRLQDHAELPVARHAHAPEAAKVYEIVSDLSILKLNYLAEYAQIGARLDSLKREGLLDDARAYAGGAFLDEVLACHAEYGEALGVFSPAAASAADDRSALERGEARLALVEAIAEYTYQVLALARAGRPETWTAVRAALVPVAALRERQAESLRAEAPRHAPAEHPPIERVPPPPAAEPPDGSDPSGSRSASASSSASTPPDPGAP